MRRSRWPLVLGLVLVIVGLLGMMAGGVIARLESRVESGASRGGRTPSGQEGSSFDGYASNGQRIYYTGVGHDGPIAREWLGSGGLPGMMGQRGRGGRGNFGGMGCVMCHREDGRGGRIGMMGQTAEAPDIRYDTLASEEESGAVGGWSSADIARAIRDGIEPNGERQNDLMPRWDMDGTDMRDTIDYLKELSSP